MKSQSDNNEEMKSDSAITSDSTQIDNVAIEWSYLTEGDSLARCMTFGEAPMTDIEKEVHRLLWSREEIRSVAKELQSKNVVAFTMTDDWEDNGGEADLYTVSFYESLEEHDHRIETFRVNLPSGTIEKLNSETGEWEIINE